MAEGGWVVLATSEKKFVKENGSKRVPPVPLVRLAAGGGASQLGWRHERGEVVRLLKRRLL